MTTVLSTLAKLVLGVTLAIAILAGGGALAVFYFMNKSSTPPPKPMFANDKPAVIAKHPSKTTKGKSSKPSAQSNDNNAAPKPLEPGAYRAKVTWADGLSLRSEPDSSSESIGSLNYNQKIVVLSDDNKNWQRVRSEESGKEGWVRAGNTERVDN